MSIDDDMPFFGQPEKQKEKAHDAASGMPNMSSQNDELPGLSTKDQKEAVKSAVRLFLILAAVLIGGALLYNGAVYAWHKYTIFKAEEERQVKQYKPKELPSVAPPPTPAVETPPVVNPIIAPDPVPVAAPVLKQSSSTIRPKQETAADRKYLEDVQRALKGGR